MTGATLSCIVILAVRGGAGGSKGVSYIVFFFRRCGAAVGSKGAHAV